LSSTSQHQTSHVSEGPAADAELAPEPEELSPNVLGLIGAYRMGAALDAQDLFAKRTRTPAS
jgi:hypothetical protein